MKRLITVRFPSEKDMIEFGKKIDIKHFTKDSIKRSHNIKYKKQDNTLESFFG